MRLAWPTLLVALLVAAPAAPVVAPEVTARDVSKPVRVAVLDVAVVDNSYGGDSDRLRAWLTSEVGDPADLLRRAVANPATYASIAQAPQFVAVDGARVAAALDAATMTARQCANAGCWTAIGRAVGADRVVTAEVTKLSVLIWFVTARVADVRTGRVLRQDEFEVKGDITDLLPKVMVILARRFAQA